VHRYLQYLLIPVVLGLFLLAWDRLVVIMDYPPYFMPAPGRVFERLVDYAAGGELWIHTAYTLVEAVTGFTIAVGFSFFVGYLLAKSSLLEKLVSPYLVAAISIPWIAMAPLLIVWFGSGLEPKIVLCFLVVFFPILINVVLGFRSVPPEMRELMATLKATRWQTFIKVELPSALPMLLSGLKVGATLSVIGAVVGEFAGSDRGLGYLTLLAGGLYDTSLKFVAFFMLIVMGISFYLAVSLVERWLLSWQRERG
jgi:NitT/TauT family transport system permease protein